MLVRRLLLGRQLDKIFGRTVLHFDFVWNERSIEIGSNNIEYCERPTLTRADIGNPQCVWGSTPNNNLVEPGEECDDGMPNEFPGTDGCFNGMIDKYFTCT